MKRTGHWSPVTGHCARLTAALRGVIPACILVFQGDSTRSTRSGVYTSDQAARGKEVYALNCASCHTAASHRGPGLVAKWDGHPLWEMFDYIRSSMPKSEPGSLTIREYTRVLAYLLKMNGMPAGPSELSADSVTLTRIRIDLKATGDSSQKR